ncbi:MAG: IS110 family transposase, partial [Candidatus Nealsonbacteria bacterium]
MKNCNDQKLKAITPGTLIVGVDIAKKTQWARFVDYRGKVNVVMVNPYHTKRAKELDDNSQTKSDKKDALTIARLVRDG